MEIGQLAHQGDVIIQRIEQLPTTAKKQEIEKSIVLAYGEVTGHCHQIATPKEVNVYIEGARQFLEVCYVQGATITHEEHAPITLDPGIYEISIQAEYFPQAVRSVLD